MSTSGSKLTGLRRINPVTGRPCGPVLTTTPAKKGDGHGVKPMPRFFYSEDTYHGNAVACTTPTHTATPPMRVRC